MHKEIVDDARLKMKVGLDKVADTVKVTMGVKGKSVALKTNPRGRSLVTNDGVTISRELLPLKDKTENIGAELINEAAEKTNDNAGDGTTSTMLLMQAMVDAGMKAVASGADGIELRKGMLKALANILKELGKERVDADNKEMLEAVATISCRDKELGKLIASVVKQAGEGGMVTIEDRFEDDTTHEKQEGLKLTGGYLHEGFINLPERRQVMLKNVPILVTDRTITLGQEMGKIMETVAKTGAKEAVVIAGGVDGDALATAWVNWQKRAIFVLPIRVIAYGDLGQGLLKDVAAITGATYIDEQYPNILEMGDEELLGMLGTANKVVTDKHSTTVVADNEELTKKRVKALKAALDDATEFEAENIQERIAKLNSAMFTIQVGGKTETERNELKTRVDDAIKAARAAYEEGIVAGGGSALYRASQVQKTPDITTDEGIGMNVVYKACIKPIEQMAENSGHRLDRTDLDEIAVDSNLAIDFSTGEVEDAYDTGIIDPFKVVQESIENATKQAGLFLTIDKAVYGVEPEVQETV